MTPAFLPLTPADQADIRLGLIGDHIGPSRSPALHRLAERLCGLRVSSDLLIPPRLGLPFEAVLAAAQAAGLAGVNVTLPYKERVVPLVQIADPMVARIGAVSTVRFAPDGQAWGLNTDHSGFVAAYRAGFGTAVPGRMALIGAGGAGRAVAFGLLTLGAAEILVIDRGPARSARLVRALLTAGAAGARMATLSDIGRVDGLVNATPIGMTGFPGSPVPDAAFPAADWAFDAVYTPVDTRFRAQALAAGARFLSGWEMFFHQATQAFEFFTARRPDPGALRAGLGDAPPPA